MYYKLNRWESQIFWIMILIHLIPLWSVDYFPTQDGPVHLENAVILNEYNNPEAGILRIYYELNYQDPSNWLIQLILCGLTLISPLLIAEKLLVSIYILLFPLSFRYCLKSVNPQSTYFSFFIFPFVYNYTLHMGFYGFSYSLILFFVLFGFWVKHRDKFTAIKLTSLIGMTLITYLLHIISLVMVYTAIGWLILLFYLHDLNSQKRTLLNDRLKHQVMVVFIALLPTLLLMILFFSKQGINLAYSSTFTDRLIQLGALSSLYSYIRTELLIAVMIVLLLFFLSIYVINNKIRTRRINIHDHFLIIYGLFLGIYFLAPDKIANGEIINARLMLYCYFILLIWIGSQTFRKNLISYIVLSPIVISLFILGLNASTYAKISNNLEAFIYPSQLIQENTTLLPLSFYETKSNNYQSLPAYRVNPFIHAASLISANARIANLGNYQAWKEYFPIQYRPQLNPMHHLAIYSQMETVPPAINIPSYTNKSGGRVDYVLIWSLNKKYQDHLNTLSIMRQLDQGYTQIYESPGPENLRLYISNDFHPYKHTNNYFAGKKE